MLKTTSNKTNLKKMTTKSRLDIPKDSGDIVTTKDTTGDGKLIQILVLTDNKDDPDYAIHVVLRVTGKTTASEIMKHVLSKYQPPKHRDHLVHGLCDMKGNDTIEGKGVKDGNGLLF